MTTPASTTPTVVDLFDRFADGAYTLAVRMLADRHLAEDVVQETFIQVLNKLDTWRGDGSLEAWLYRIAYNQAITVIRRRREEPMEPEKMARLADRSRWDVEATVVAGEIVRRLDSALHHLSPALSAAFVLRDIEGLSTREVARALDISESSTKMRLKRARMALRSELREFL